MITHQKPTPSQLQRLFGAILSLSLFLGCAQADYQSQKIEALKAAFQSQSIELNTREVEGILPDVTLALEARCKFGPTGNNSKATFSAVEIAHSLGLNPKADRTVVGRVEKALTQLPCHYGKPIIGGPRCSVRPEPQVSWENYYNQTIQLTSNKEFLKLVQEKSFSPVKISWEDIGRYQGSVWGDRISDVGIWVRREESDPSSAALALSVRRDNNFRDKVLMVPSEKIKIHLKENGNTREVSLKDRLRELSLLSENRDKHVIVSNQFAVVPVPARDMVDVSSDGHPPRAAFNFSIFPYGSYNYVITDVIEGSSDAIVGPGTHQYLYANVQGKKAPFTASRASDRPDLMKLEETLKAKGMDVDVQRYYLIQVPLKKGAEGIRLSNLGTPPFSYKANSSGPMLYEMQVGAALEGIADKADMSPNPQAKMVGRGLAKVAIGHGELEGPYNRGSGFRHMRADEPVRVTVVYFVTPVGEVTRDDMESFTKVFESWDERAIWGGSFVVKE